MSSKNDLVMAMIEPEMYNSPSCKTEWTIEELEKRIADYTKGILEFQAMMDFSNKKELANLRRDIAREKAEKNRLKSILNQMKKADNKSRLEKAIA